MIKQNTSDCLGDCYRTGVVTGGLSDDDAWDYALVVTLGGVGVAPPYADLDRHARWCIARHRELLSGAELFVVSPAAHAAVMAAAATLDIADTATLDRETDLPVATGLLMLPGPVVLSNRVGSLSDITAYGWAPTPLFSGWPPVDGGRAGVRVTAFMDRDGPVQPEEWRLLVGTARRNGTPLPALVPDGMEGMVGDRYLAELSAEELRERARQSNQVQLAMRQHAQVRGLPPETGQWVGGDPIEDPNQDFSRRYMFAFWRLAAQKSTSVSVHPARDPGQLPGQRRPLRLAQTPQVRVVQLTAPRGGGAENEGTTRLYQHRFPVRMHKVRQWYPSQGIHRIIWRGPYIKGPTDAPLLVTEKAYAVT
ncbi:hypothetical protein [Kitasatospora indigofera]|uniref:hypothetical protein n=1 Tax=Kitasatospora indigofera TaxID=67307 RepID=UPI0036CF349D